VGWWADWEQKAQFSEQFPDLMLMMLHKSTTLPQQAWRTRLAVSQINSMSASALNFAQLQSLLACDALFGGNNAIPQLL
jgi:hypothetical protein